MARVWPFAPASLPRPDALSRRLRSGLHIGRGMCPLAARASRASADFETVKWIYLRKTGETYA